MKPKERLEQAGGAAKARVLLKLEEDVARSTGRSVAELRTSSLCDLRRQAEVRTGRVTRFVSRFPLIGRGNVNSDRIVESKDIDDEVDRILAR
ncbi:MAG: hypothetical protein A2Z18_01700 [Armatimonadetes bacterium RBG_16_58_9]|nr:MAG: hypothetical protein A2Z18_01700 [Armatimonadetes bacterium RBG_16_58_9]